MFKHCIFLDAGHGGREASGCYTTAPSRMWDLKKGTFHNGSIFYEGVKNREYADIIAAKLVSVAITPTVNASPVKALKSDWKIDMEENF
jgi:hypothetical protein